MVKMINLLVENNNSNWDKIFSFVFDIFLFIFDVIWNTKLPMTNTLIAYFLVFFMVIKLSIYVIHGTSTQYNILGLTVNNGVSQVYSSTVRKGINVGKNVYQNSNKQHVKKELKRQSIRYQAKNIRSTKFKGDKK
ncbi:plectrovirus-related protein [Spiroplasma citri]|nr:plectrovirus-related protein [Spiroplasma citri]